MEVPLTTQDFIDRAEVAYGDTPGVIDEPGVPGGLGTLTYAQLAARARAFAAALDGLGVGPGERVAIVSPNCARLPRGASSARPLRARARAGQLPAQAPTRSRTSSSTPAPPVLLVDPELDASLAELRRAAPVRARGEPTPRCSGDRRRARAVGARRGRDRDDQLHRAAPPRAQGRAAHAPQPAGSTRRRSAGTSGSATATSTCTRCRCSTATAGACRYAVTAMGGAHVVLRKVDGAEILRRVEQHGVTLLCGAPAVVAAVLDAARDVGGGRSPARGPVRDRRRRRAAADARRSSASRPSSAGSSSRSTGSPRPRRC